MLNNLVTLGMALNSSKWLCSLNTALLFWGLMDRDIAKLVADNSTVLVFILPAEENFLILGYKHTSFNVPFVFILF